jgi:translation initiation factor IF-1
MVYNVGGGNKSKGLARKFVVQAQNQGGAGGKTVRTVKESGEQYAIVQKHLGNCMCMVYCSDGYRRLCIIRKKFTGRRKTDNNISSGSVVMVGLHDYSGSGSGEGAGTGKGAGDVKRCDLLYVYSEQEKEKLRKVCDLSKLSASLDDTSSKSGQQSHSHSQSQSQEQAFEIEFDSSVAFVTSGTGVFNKYAKDDARGRGAATNLLSKSSGNSGPASKNVISGTDWLDDLPPINDDDDDDDEADKNKNNNQEEEEEEEEEEVMPTAPNKSKSKVGSSINIDDI